MKWTSRDTATQPEARTLLAVRILVADGTVMLQLSGELETEDVTDVACALTEACEMCRGVVLLDVSQCAGSGADVVEAVVAGRARAGAVRCRVCVVGGDPAMTTAMKAAGLECQIAR